MFLNSCSSVYYLYQAGKGQLKLFNRGRPIQEVMEDERTSAEMRTLLSHIPEIKQFGERFGLKPTKNYQEYVELDQDYVVYVVTVSDELKFKPKYFSFPIVGSFNYLGWFSESDAREFAEEYAKQGFDIDVRGASAYSTLGWFKDPLLSSMIPQKNGKPTIYAFPELVNVFIHESVHATVYISNQSYFNESLASFIADRLTERFFEERKQTREEFYLRYLEQVKYTTKVREKFAQAYQTLEKIYDSGISDTEKRSKKEKILGDLRQELNIRRKLSNASLIQYKTYHAEDEGFRRLYERVHRDMNAFVAAVSRLKPEDFPKHQLEELEVVLDRLL